MKITTYLLLAAILALLLGSCKDYKWSNIFDPDNDLPTVSTPVITPQGNTYAVAQQVTISCATQDAQIYYTLDGSEPGTGSTLYTEAVFIPQDLTLKARAYKQGFNASQISTASYVITTPTCANPYFSPGADVYSTPQNVVITCTTQGAEIRYTTDGSDPTPASGLYGEPIYLASTTTIKARAYKSGITSSQIMASVYSFVAAMPEMTPPGGSYTSPQSVKITCATPGAVVKYTLDGTEPTNSSNPYTQPIYVATDQTIKARAYKDGSAPSQTTTASYTINLKVANPVFFPDPGMTYNSAQMVSITCATPGASIYYTMDGSAPNQGSTAYTGVLDIPDDATIKAIAYKTGWQPSEVVAAVYTIFPTVPAPVIDPPPGNYPGTTLITIKCSLPGALIRYTTNGSAPNSNSTLYTGPFNISSDVAIRARAFKTQYADSNTTTATYTIGLLYDFEGSEGNFISQGWVHGTPTQVTPHSGSELWALCLDGEYQQNAYFNLFSPSWLLGQNAVFSFWHAYDFSRWAYYDPIYPAVWHSQVGYVYITDDNGVNWTQLTSSQGNADFRDSSPWGRVTYDLSLYADKSVTLRIYLFSRTDAQYYPRPGWFVDDVRITNATEILKGGRAKE